VTKHIDTLLQKMDYSIILENNLIKIEQLFSWPKVNNSYLSFFKEVYEKN